MVQFNLLPDIKLEFIKTQARKRLIILASFITSAVFLTIFILLLINVKFAQHKRMNDLTKDIKSSVATIRKTQDLDKIITVQNQLASLPGLHDQKIISSRITDYLIQLTPANVKITDVDADFVANTFSIKGTASELSTVNQFVDTLKFTTFKVNTEGGPEGKAFSGVVLSSFSVQDKATNPAEKVTFNISATFDPYLFKMIKKEGLAEDKAVSLVIPNIISTRSVTEKPTDLFGAPPVVPKEGQ
ncbi:hypothetical protein A3F37_04010 [Candidatus Saccharibacteria bacterium RIFCSPHIGHO2_12_FULL_41_12]|nr:MAG: hypothetical protein A3F37_04010 [Candidatus Saccharibacteria bacterium RIFCSPHIGHO2_12_FULL_41_12]